jgi:hypothetical protein
MRCDPALESASRPNDLGGRAGVKPGGIEDRQAQFCHRHFRGIFNIDAAPPAARAGTLPSELSARWSWNDHAG